MISAGIKDIKNNLSRLLARVKAGEEILITERGRPVARIVQANQRDESIRTTLEPLVRKGLVAWPSRSILKERITALEVSGKPVSDIVIEDRR
jgi:prevent-host-death family protein